MKIGIDGRALQQKLWGGVGQYTYNLLHALFGLDKKNEYVVWYNAASALELPTFSQYPNVTVHRTRWPNKVLNAAMRVVGCPKVLPLRVRGSQRGLRTVHNSPQPPLTLRGGGTVDIFFMPNLNFIALPSHTKLILTIHDLSFVHFPEHYSLKSRLWHRAVGPTALLKRADRIIAVSEHTQGDLVKTYGIAPEKISVVYPGVNQRLASSVQRLKSDSLDPRPYTLAPTPYILYFGALEPRKNIEGLIAAYEALQPPEQLVLAGLDTPYVKRIKKRIAQSPRRDYIMLKENPTEEEKHALYAGATIFVYPSFYEGFGFPPLEAMAHSVPVVASAVSSIPEVCGDAAVLVNPWKKEEIADGMRVLLENEELRRKYAERGKTRAAQFSWQNCAQQMLQLFSYG